MESGKRVVAWSVRPISRRLMAAILVEYERNGRKPLSPGKLRHLRRQVRRRGGISGRSAYGRKVPLRFGQTRVQAPLLYYWPMGMPDQDRPAEPPGAFRLVKRRP